MKITTNSGSIYEIDLANRKIRFIEKSKTSETDRVTHSWRDYWSISPETPKVGSVLLIVWDHMGQDGSFKTTITSIVKTTEGTPCN